MSKERNYKFETLQLHVGQEQPDPVTDAVPNYWAENFIYGFDPKFNFILQL